MLPPLFGWRRDGEREWMAAWMAGFTALCTGGDAPEGEACGGGKQKQKKLFHFRELK